MQDSHLKNIGDERTPQNAQIETISADLLADVLRATGYRVTATEQNGLVQLMSASQGVGFTVRFGNPAAQLAPRNTKSGAQPYIDYTLSCVLQVQGDLPAEVVADWNRSKRFARLASHGQFLALEMDVVVAGGVSERHLRSTIELWDRLIQEFLLHLRNRLSMTEQEPATGVPAADKPTREAAAQS
ncbi:YbjN domain-containing protein [Candidimonas nitroreducens]|uniref:Bacterial sensory transduction regulator family protein n=1 Tax=Candidimonas nitroreducens TaxID=683354 RepID=A0A225MTR5_9BURK|nr:YbjN domain-containing protein [Candidimonas nitroreducens]OWT62039.1 bacterial sensory transduction regulator family protein [Candidimonas nitroreducens]